MRFSSRASVTVFAGLALLAASCGSDGVNTDDGAAGDDAESADVERPTVVVTTNILGDVVENLVGELADVVTIMPVGADPHDFQASAQQVAQIGDADVLIVNGGDFEEGLADVIESAAGDGVPVFAALSAVETLAFGEHDHGDPEHVDEDDHDHADEADEDDHTDEAGDDDHDHDGVDPHFFTDPARMAVAADAIASFLADTIAGVDAEVLAANAAAYVDELQVLDAEAAEAFSAIPDDRRVLVTNHEVFGYFAERYDFEVVGTVIPGGTTVEGLSAQELAQLAEVVEHEQVPAIFADTSSSDELAQTLAAEVGDIEVVELYSESLGDDGSDGATYLAMVRTNAERIVAALAG